MTRNARAILPAIGLLIFGFSANGGDTNAADRWRSSGRSPVPLDFEINQGQAGTGVRFLARAPGYLIALGAGSEVSFLDRGGISRMEFFGANAGAAGKGERRLESTTHWYHGSDTSMWRAEIPHYSRLRYTNLYPGIDVIWSGLQQDLEYTFEVSPGADPNNIVIHFDGVRPPSIDKDGALVLEAGMGMLRHRAPFAYQRTGGQRKRVSAEFYLQADGSVAFRIGSYDRRQPLWIDPVLAYSSYAGGLGFDASYAVATDTSGAIYLTGETESLDFPHVIGTRGITPIRRDAFVTKLTPDGSAVVYTTIMGSTGNDCGKALAVDAMGNAFVAGVAGGTGFPITAGALSTTSGGAEDAFIVRLDASGRIVYSTYFGGAGTDVATSIQLDAQGNAYVAGYTNSARFPTTPGAPQTTYKGGAYDAFVARIGATGSNLLTSTLLGGFGNDIVQAIAPDSVGGICVAGRTDSTDFPVINATQTALRGGGDAFAGCLNAGGTAWRFLTYLGGTSEDAAYALTGDSTGALYIAGSTLSPNFPIAGGAVQSVKSNDYDAFITKLSFTGSIVFSTFLGGGGSDSAAALGIDDRHHIWVAGYTNSADFPALTALQGYAGNFDAFVAELSTDGAPLLFSTYLGGSGDDRATALTATEGRVVFTGFTASTREFPITSGALQGTASASYNAFLSIITTPPIINGVTPSSGTGMLQSFTVAVSDPNGYAALDYVYLLINRSFSGATGCYLVYNRGANLLWLASDSGTAWSQPASPGSSTTLANSQCSVNLGASSVTGSGNNLTLTFALSFQSGFSGTKNFYVRADRAGATTDWQIAGTWTVPDNAPPTLLGISPSSGSGSARSFTISVSDPNGYAALDYVYLLVNRVFSGSGGCYLVYNRGANLLWLAGDSGTAWSQPASPGFSTNLSNSQCSVNLGASSVTGSGNNLTLSFALTFLNGFSGTKNLYVRADRASATTDWQIAGTWTVPDGAPLALLGISPSSGAGSARSFTISVSDPNGYAALDYVYFLINRVFSGSGGCYLVYNRGANLLWLASDSGTAWSQPASPGSSSNLSNSQCSVNLGASSVSSSGPNLTLSFALTFFPNGFSGAKNLYVRADRVNATTDWQIEGTWTVF